MGWLRRLLGQKHPDTMPSVSKQVVDDIYTWQAEIKDSGSVDGDHYTDYVGQVKQLKREKRHEEAIQLLLKLVNATEDESKTAGEGWGVAPWYYEQLAILYRKEKRIRDEVAILERYGAQPKSPGAGPAKLAARLEKARELAAKRF